MATSIWFWVGFHVLVLALLALDLGVFNRRPHVVSIREATGWSVLWVVLSLLFGLWVGLYAGKEAGFEFLTGYLLEKALAVDNIFVFVLVFSAFGVKPEYQHRVLFWGILGALVLRGAFIAAGSLVLERWHGILYVFGAFLVVTGIRMALAKEQSVKPQESAVLRLARRFLPVAAGDYGPRFFVRENGRRMATSLFLVLLVVEATDVVFAVDSIPAIFAVTQDPFLVYTSNVMAILGLRSMYFLLAGVVHKFVYLKYGLSLVLTFIGAKMLAMDVVHVPVTVSLGVVAALVVGSIAVSLLRPPREGDVR